MISNFSALSKQFFTFKKKNAESMKLTDFMYTIQSKSTECPVYLK